MAMTMMLPLNSQSESAQITMRQMKFLGYIASGFMEIIITDITLHSLVNGIFWLIPMKDALRVCARIRNKLLLFMRNIIL